MKSSKSSIEFIIIRPIVKMCIRDRPWEWLDGKRPKTIYVHPLLLVLGDHAQNDLFGDEEDSVVNELSGAGYAVKPIHSALGEYEAIHDIFRQHVQDCIDDLYGKRSPQDVYKRQIIKLVKS